MNASHFHTQPLFLQWRGVVVPGHEIYTRIDDQQRTAVVYCYCGWSASRTLAEMLERQDATCADLSAEAFEHLREAGRKISLAELTELGWFDPEVW